MKRLPKLLPIRHIFLFTLVLLFVSQAAISMYAWSVIEESIRPELERKASVVGASIGGKLERALAYGVPFDKLEGVEDFFDEVLQSNPDLAFLGWSNANGELRVTAGVPLQRLAPGLAAIRPPPLYAQDAPLHALSTVATKGDAAKHYLDAPYPVRHNGKTVGILHVGIEQSFIASQISDLRYDVGTILLTSMLIAFEILLFVVFVNFSRPMHQVAELMSRLAAGDFRHRASLSVRGRVGLLAERLNQLVAQTNSAFMDATRNVSAGGADGSLAAPAREAHATMLARLRKRYAFAEDGVASDLKQRGIMSVRILTFLFMTTEMLSRPFLPLYAATLPASPLSQALPSDLLASLPVTAFLLGVACSMPMAGRLSDHMGRRKSYLVGAALIVAGLLATGAVPDFSVVLGARLITGIGYAMMFMACQGYVVDNTDASNRGRGMAMFVGAIMVAEICAPAVGGILADRIGFRLVFITGACVALLAAALASRILDSESATDTASAETVPVQISVLLRNRRFVAVSILAGIPAKLLLSGFLIYLVPVILTGFGSSKSEVGRYAMIYGVVALALTPVFARLADRYRIHGPMVGVGGLLTGLGLLPILVASDSANVLIGIAALGLGQSMSISAQLVLVTKVTAKEARTFGATPILGLFRLIERLGGAAGPALAGLLASLYGASTAMALLGVLSVVSSLLFLCVYFVMRDKDDSRRDPQATGAPNEAAA